MLRALLLTMALAAPALGAPAPGDRREELVAAIATGSRAAVDHAIERIRYLGKPRPILYDVAALVGAGDERARFNAVYVFSILSDPAYGGAVAPALADANPAVRERACTAIGKMNYRAALPDLVRATRDASPPVRREAFRALGRMRVAGTSKALVAGLKDAELEPRIAAILALGELGDAHGSQPLLALLSDPSESVRLAATRSLCQLGNPRARQAVAALAASAEAQQRIDAARLLDGLRAPWSEKLLIGLLQDAELGVRIAAARSLGRPRGVEWLVREAARAEPRDQLQMEIALEELAVSPEERAEIRAKQK